MTARKIIRWKDLTQFSGDSFFQSMMGHGLFATCNSELIDKLVDRGFLIPPPNCPTFVDQVKSVERSIFAPISSQVYSNQPVSYPSTQSAFSTPQFHAQILSVIASRLGPGRKAMEIGCGSGYLPAVMTSLGCDKVFAIENSEALLEKAISNLKHFDNCFVQKSAPKGVIFDAVSISPYFESFSQLEDFAASNIIFSDDAILVAAYRESPTQMEQQLVVHERTGSEWKKQPLFRVICEPFR